jgi:hypothetical protein
MSAVDNTTLEGLILQALAASPDAVIEDSHVWAEGQNVDPQAVVGALKSLAVDAYVETAQLNTSYLVLSKEAETIVSNGASPEFLVWKAVQAAGNDGISLGDLSTQLGKEAKIGMANAMKVKWLKKDGTLLKTTVDSVTDEVQIQLKAIVDQKGALEAVDDKVR